MYIYNTRCTFSHVNLILFIRLLAQLEFIHLFIYFPRGQCKWSIPPTPTTDYAVEFPTSGGIAGGQHIRSAVDKLCPGKTTFMTTVSPLPGKYTSWENLEGGWELSIYLFYIPHRAGEVEKIQGLGKTEYSGKETRQKNLQIRKARKLDENKHSEYARFLMMSEEKSLKEKDKKHIYFLRPHHTNCPPTPFCPHTLCFTTRKQGWHFSGKLHCVKPTGRKTESKRLGNSFGSSPGCVAVRSAEFPGMPRGLWVLARFLCQWLIGRSWSVDKEDLRNWKDRFTIHYLKPLEPDVFLNSEFYRF